jgi:mxaD protein
MKKITLIVAALFFFAAAVHAHGPVRAKQTLTVLIDAPAEDVWAVIKNYDDMSWHPAFSDTTAEGGNKKGATRVLTLKSGGTINEEMKAYKDDKMSYKYKITDMSSAGTIQHSGQEENIPVLPVNNYAATLSVKAKGNQAEVSWVATYYRAYLNNNPPPELDEEAADNAVEDALKAGLVSLLHRFEPGADASSVKVKIKR